MDHYQVVQAVSLGEVFDEKLAAGYRVLPLWQKPIPLEDLAAHAAEATALVTSVRHGASRELIAALPALRALCSWGVGYETLDIAAANSRNILVSNTPHVLDGCVADMAWALLLSTARRIPQADRYVKGGEWRQIGAYPLSTRVWGKRLGILGMGRIGAEIAQRGSGFQMEVRYCNRQPKSGVPYEYEPSLRALAQWSDFLMIACPGGPETHHIVDAEIIKALGPDGILVNIARGTVIDERAMVAALRQGALRGAGLDVLEHEPVVPEAFSHMDGITLTPHIGSATHETRADMAALVLDNIRAFFSTGRLVTPVRETPNP